jgi:hypothetical protein
MALIALASARSPGLTTAAVAIASGWPAPRRAVLAELDPDGGTLAGRHAANPEPGLKTLAAAGRHYLSPAMVIESLQHLPAGLPVLLSPPSPDRTVAALAALSPVGLGETLRCLPGFDVLADCGRIDSNSPALPTLREADAVVFVVRSTTEDIVGLRDRLETLDLTSTQLRAGIVVVDSGPHRPGEVAGAFRLPVIGTLDWDPRTAEAICESRRLPHASKLMRSAARVAADLAAQLPAPAAAVDPRAGLRPYPPPPPPSTGAPSPAWGSAPTDSPWGQPRTSTSEVAQP